MIGITLSLLLLIMFLFLLFALTMKSLLKSAISLACASVILTIILFIVLAPWAAVFELSVCAGLITVVFIATISMTDMADKIANRKSAKLNRKKCYPLYVLLAIVFCITAYFLYQNAGAFVQTPEIAYDFKELLWNTRQTDITGQIILILAAVFGIVVFFKEVE